MLEKNLYACSDDEVCAKITDFGMATYVDPNGGERLFCGSDEYMAPEIIKQPSNPDLEPALKDKNIKYNTRIDIWALGCITYELFNKRPPFRGASYKKLHHMILEKEPDLNGNPNLERCPLA